MVLLMASLLVLSESFVPVLVIDAPGFGTGEGVVGFGDFDEFLLGGFVATVNGVSSAGLCWGRGKEVVG